MKTSRRGRPIDLSQQNYKLKLKNDDYKNQDPDTALMVCTVYVYA